MLLAGDTYELEDLACSHLYSSLQVLYALICECQPLLLLGLTVAQTGHKISTVEKGKVVENSLGNRKIYIVGKNIKLR